MRGQRGQSLIEVLIALAAAVAIVAAIAVAVITSLSNVEFTKNQNLATQYSREGIEIVRQMAKDNWTSFSNLNSVNYCLAQGSTTLTVMNAGGCGKNVSIFVRQITINQNAISCSGSTKIISSVSWSDSKCLIGNIFCHQVSVESCLAKINTITSP